MWKYKEFKTEEDKDNWIERNRRRYQFSEIFVNNKIAIEYKPLRKIY